MTGWIKLFYQFKDWEWYGDTNMVRLFIHLLLSANYKSMDWRGITIPRGSLITSRSKLAEQTNLSEREVRTCLNRLKLTNEITIEIHYKFTVITINNYGRYQNEDSLPDQQNNKPAKEQPEPQPAEGLNEEKFIEFFNQEMEANNALIPKINSMGKKRKTHLYARFREHGKAALERMVRNAARSDFLNGKNSRGWKATFDWLILPTNFPKVVEGSYENITIQTNNYPNYGTIQKDRYALRRAAEPAATSPEAYTDTF